MSNIDWSKAPEWADGIKMTTRNMYWTKKDAVWDFANKMWVPFRTKGKTISTRPQPRKTVKDAVDAHPNGWEDAYLDGICYKDGLWYYLESGESQYQVCTRAEFDAEVERQNGEEWTHTTNSGYKCRIYVKEPDVNGTIIVINSDGEYMRHYASSLKPITRKPAISAEAMKAVESFAYILMGKESYHLESEVAQFRTAHDITE